jgi:hypothetical protein
MDTPIIGNRGRRVSMRSCRAVCGVFLLVTGLVWFGHLTGFIPVGSVLLKGIVPAVMVVCGVLVLSGAHRCNTKRKEKESVS